MTSGWRRDWDVEMRYWSLYHWEGVDEDILMKKKRDGTPENGGEDFYGELRKGCRMGEVGFI